MAQFDLPLEQLYSYNPAIRRPADLSEFWQRTTRAARDHPLDVRMNAVHTGSVLVETFDVEFSGFAGDRIKAWLKVPHEVCGRPLPAVVEYVGYGGGRGLASEPSVWAQAGFAHFVMDTRGQGSASSVGHTPDDVHGAVPPSHPGFMTRGIGNRETYYYRRLFTDAVRAIEAVNAIELINREQIFATGTSQGGGVALAVAGLADGLAGVMADVPFLCHFERAISITDSDPFNEITRYLRVHRDQTEVVLETLAYFDAANLSSWAYAPALFSVALMDDVVPPSTVFAAYNGYPADKQIVVYPFNRHEGGQRLQDERKVKWAIERIGSLRPTNVS